MPRPRLFFPLPPSPALEVEESLLPYGDLLFFQRWLPDPTEEDASPEWIASSVLVVERESMSLFLWGEERIKGLQAVGSRPDVVLPLLRYAKGLPEGQLLPFDRQDALTLWGESLRLGKTDLASACERLLNEDASFPRIRLFHHRPRPNLTRTTAFFYTTDGSFHQGRMPS